MRRRVIPSSLNLKLLWLLNLFKNISERSLTKILHFKILRTDYQIGGIWNGRPLKQHGECKIFIKETCQGLVLNEKFEWGLRRKLFIKIYNSICALRDYSLVEDHQQENDSHRNGEIL